jgi:hypothetical protein
MLVNNLILHNTKEFNQPLSLLIGIFSLEGFDLNDLTLIPRDFGILVMVMTTMIGMLYLFLEKELDII